MEYDLVFEGGGAKGMIFVGAMQAFSERGYTHGRLLGTSAGAITAALLAAGYSNQEMLAALAEQQDGKSVFSAFMGLPKPLSPQDLQTGSLSALLKQVDLPIVSGGLEERLEAALPKSLSEHPVGVHLLSFIERGGWFSADAFVEWMSKKLDSGFFNGKARARSALTLQQFHAITGKDLSLVAANVSKGIKLVLNHRTAPQLPVVWAVRMSMSIPLLWQEVIWQEAWGEYRGNPLRGDTIVDGGLLSNFPIELFISDQKQVTEVMEEKRHENVLGLLIDESSPVVGAPPPAPHKESEFDLMQLATVHRVLNLVTTMLEAHDKDVISAFADLVARLPAGGYGTTEFDMSEERRAFLVQTGYETMKSYFAKKDQQPVSFSAAEAPSLAQMADEVALRLLR